MTLLMKQSFLSTGVILYSLVNANSVNFIDICMQYKVHNNMSEIDIKSGFKHVFSYALV